MNSIDEFIAVHRLLTIHERHQLESVLARVKRINAGQAEEGDRDPGRFFADVEFLLSLIKVNEAVDQSREGDGFIWHRQGEPEKRQVERRADIEVGSTQCDTMDSLLEEIVTGKRLVQPSYIPTGIEQPDPFIGLGSQQMLSELAEYIEHELSSLSAYPVAVVCLPEFFQKLNEKHTGGIENIRLLGLRVYQRDRLTLSEEPPHDVPFRFFFDEEELKLFLARELLERSPIDLTDNTN